jgi:hypothetical protein
MASKAYIATDSRHAAEFMKSVCDALGFRPRWLKKPAWMTKKKTPKANAKSPRRSRG